jgi:hypothetical protein
MQLEVFQDQIQRLKATYGEKNYPEERVKVLWAQFKKVENIEFADAVTYLIANYRAAPMLHEIEKEVQLAINRSQEHWLRSADRNLYGIVQDAAKYNKKADPEFVKACLKLLRDKLDGKINNKQFNEGCDLLDKAAKTF